MLTVQKILRKQSRHHVQRFSLDLDDVQISEFSVLKHNKVNQYLAPIRRRIAEFCELEYPL